MLAATGKAKRGEGSAWMHWRAFRIWKFHIGTLLFFSLAARLFFPRLRGFFTGLYEHPVSGSLLAGILAYTPEWLDVLPLYVFLLILGAFAFPAIIRGHIGRVWGFSLTVWIFAQFSLRSFALGPFPHWMHPGFFDFFAWQFLYFSGAAIGHLWKEGKIPLSEKFQNRIFSVSAVLCAFCFLWSHRLVPISPPGDFWISKEHVGALRFLNFIAFVGVISQIIRRKPGTIDFSPCRTIGRHSLEVFTAQTVCIYLWMAVPAKFQYHVPFNIAAPLLCCALLFAIAKTLERNR